MKAFLAVGLIFLASQVLALPHTKDVFSKNEERELEYVIRSHYGRKFERIYLSDNVTMLGFSYENCAPGSDLTINKLTVGPDPIVVPGTVNVGLDATIATDVTDITSAILVVKKEIFGVMVDIPCVDNVGSCTYNDICPMLANITCPQQLIDMGFTCTCPFKAKDYEVPDNTKINIPSLPIPASLENGKYEIKVTLKNGDTTLACYDFTATLKAAGTVVLIEK